MIFDFPLDSFGIHAFYHSNLRVVYMGSWVRGVGGVDIVDLGAIWQYM